MLVGVSVIEAPTDNWYVFVFCAGRQYSVGWNEFGYCDADYRWDAFDDEPCKLNYDAVVSVA
jgi:hypothetical protein